MKKDIVVLAYSGGLDTSVCLKWLQDEMNLDVVAVVGDVGQAHEGLEQIKEKALSIGVLDCHVIDMKDGFVNDYLSKAIYANAMYENKYPLLSALSRPAISKHLVDIASQYKAKYIAHGCTGKGNDQVRFEAAIKMIDPSLEILAPVRVWDLKSRDAEIAWAVEHGVPVPASKENPYSIDDNIWGRAVECGVLEDPYNEPPADIWEMTADPKDAPDTEEYVEIEFEKGLPRALNGQKMSLTELIEEMNIIAGRNAVGRIDMIENRLVGVKSRECYEVPAGTVLITAHKALEDLVLEKDVLHLKLDLEHKWATTVYNGMWFAPVKDALDAFFLSTQQTLSGTVRVKLYKGNCTVVGRKSAFSLYNPELATYGDEDKFDHGCAEGFIYVNTLAAVTWAQTCKENNLDPTLFNGTSK